MPTSADNLRLLDQIIASARQQLKRSDDRPSVTLTYEQVRALQRNDPMLESKKRDFRAMNPIVKVIGKPKGTRLRRVDTV